MNFRTRSSASIKGFTLIEVFLAAALMGIILLTIFSAYASGIRIWRSVKELGLAENSKVFIAMEKIERELKGYMRDFKEIGLEGDKEELSFPIVSGREILKVTYQFDKNRKLFLKKTAKFSESLKESILEKKDVLFGAKNVRFEYFFYDPANETGNYWISDFAEEDDGVPQAVRFTITVNDKEFSKYVFIPF